MRVDAPRLAGILGRLDRQTDEPAPDENLTESDARVLGAVAQHRRPA